MSWFKNLFGDSKGKAAASAGGGAARSNSSSPPPPGQDDKEGMENMARIDTQIEMIEKRIDHNTLQLREQEEKIKAIMRECGTDEKKKERRKPELMRIMQQVTRTKKHVADDQKKLDNFMSMKDTLVTSVQAVTEVSVMKDVGKYLKTHQPSEKEVDDIKDGLDEVMEASQRTSERLAEGFIGGVQATEDDLEEFMAGLQDEVAEETAQHQAALPDIKHPQVVLPAAGKKQLPKQSAAAAAAAAEAEAQDELDRIAASM